MNPMEIRYKIVLISVLFLVSACRGNGEEIDKLTTISLSPGYEYQLGLGYGFLDKEVIVTIDGEEVLSLVGTEEIETFAQMQGTYILASGSSPNQQITVRVAVNGNQTHEQILDLSAGAYLHIYLDNSGLNVYNTAELILE
jgi:hypothetical protein